MTEPAMPTMDELVEAGARAALGHAFDNHFWQTDGRERQYPRNQQHAQKMARQDARAILAAVLPMVLAGPREALGRMIDAKALSGVRELVAGWNGEEQPKPYNERHPAELGATLPKTNCGAVYELDEAMVAARSVLSHLDTLLPKDSGG